MTTVNSATSLADYTIANEIKNTIIYIGKTFIDPSRGTIYLGKLDSTSLERKTNSRELNFVEALLKGYVSFKARFATSLPENVSANMFQQIMIRNLDNKVYRPIGSDSFSPTNTEINFSKILVPSSELLTILDKIKNTYTFLQDEVLKNYTAGTPFVVSNYVVDDKNTSHIKITSDLKSGFLSEIAEIIGDMSSFDFVKNDVFMIRRLMLFYELLTNIYIAMYLYDISVEKGAAGDISKNLLKVISDTGNILINLNKNFIFTSDEDVPTRSRIVSNINKKAQTMNTSSSEMNTLDERVRDLKMMLSNNNNLFLSGLSKKGKAKFYEKMVLGIFIASLIVIVAVSWSPIVKTTKLLINSVVLLVLLVSAYIADYLYRRKIEGFVGELLPGGMEQGNVGTIKDQKNLLMESFENTYKAEGLNFLSISIYLGLMLQSGRTYNSMDAAMKREISYFTQMAYLVDNTNEKVYNATFLTRMDALTSAARISFFVSLGIVIGGTIMAFLIIDQNLKYQPYILGISGLLIILITARYMHEISKRVRNDPSKFYWAKPDNVSKIE